MLSDRRLLGAKVAGCWILLSLRKYAPDLDLPVRAAARNSKQFVLLCCARFCVLEEAQKAGSTQKGELFRPLKSAAEVRSGDTLQLPEELKRDVCGFFADV